MSSRNLLVHFGVRSLAAVAALYAVSVSAYAQEAASPAPSASAWLKICNTDPNTKTELCVMNQELRAETGQPIAAVTIQTTGEPGKFGLGVVVPIGFLIPPGITLTVDGTKAGNAQFAICLPPSNRQAPVCLAQAQVGEDFIAALKKGNKLSLILVTPQNKPIPIEMSLNGFSKTFDGPGVDRAAAEAQRQQLSEALQKSAEEARKKLIEQQKKEIENAPQ